MVCMFKSENEGTSTVQMSYSDRLRLSALTKQISHGKYSADVADDVGLLDVFGNDRRYAIYDAQSYTINGSYAWLPPFHCCSAIAVSPFCSAVPLCRCDVLLYRCHSSVP